MERRSLYPITIKAKVDLNTELLINELGKLLGKNQSQILRLIIADFFSRKIDIIEKHIDADRDYLTDAILKDFLDATKSEINEFRKFKNEKRKSK